MTRARRTAGVALQAGNAAIAALTAASTSAASANGTARMTCPVAGFVTSPYRPLLLPAGCPLIQSGTRVAVGLATAEVDMDSSVLTVLYSRHEIEPPCLDLRHDNRSARCGFRDALGSDACRCRVSEILGCEVAGRGRQAGRRDPQNRHHLRRSGSPS